MKKLRTPRHISETTLRHAQGGDGGTCVPPPKADLKQHVDNHGQTPML
jgi:hypothetical protein